MAEADRKPQLVDDPTWVHKARAFKAWWAGWRKAAEHCKPMSIANASFTEGFYAGRDLSLQEISRRGFTHEDMPDLVVRIRTAGGVSVQAHAECVGCGAMIAEAKPGHVDLQDAARELAAMTLICPNKLKRT